MFPDLDEFRSGETFGEHFKDLGSSFNPGWYVNIGLIYRDKHYLAHPKFHMPSLPEEVDYIKVEMHKVLASMIFITLDVYLNSSASEKLHDLQSQKYLPEVELGCAYPPERLFGFNEWPAERSRERSVIGWLENIRKGVESQIKPYLNGYFMRQTIKPVRLPAFEIYRLKRDLVSKKKFTSWLKEANNWCDSLGFQFYWGTFNNNNFAFSWGHKTNYGDGDIPHRVLVFRESFLKSTDLKMYVENKKIGVAHSINSFVNTNLVLFVAIEFLSSKVENAKKYRTEIFANMVHGNLQVSNLRKQLKLHFGLQQERLSAERFFVEFEQNKKFIQGNIEKSGLGELRYTNMMSHKILPTENLRESIVNEVDYLKKTFSDHMNLLHMFFFEYVQVLNTDAIYRLQVIVTILSIAALFGTFLGVIGWDNIFKFVNK